MSTARWFRRPVLVVASTIFVLAFVAAAAFHVAACSPSTFRGSPGTVSNPTQTWVLTNEGGQSVTVTVPSGVYGSTFTTTSGQWYALDRHGTRVTVDVGGNVNGAIWRFVTMNGHNEDVSIVGNGDGTANASYPDSTSVTGTCTWNFAYVNGMTSSSTFRWTGVRTR